MKKNERGRSMVEMLGVLAIVAVLSVAGLAGFGKAMEKYKANTAKDQFREIANNTLYVFYNQKDYSALGTDCATGTENAIRFGIIPENMIDKTIGGGGNTALHAFGGQVCIYAVDYAGVNAGAFAIEFHGLPRRVAMELAIDGNNDGIDTLMTTGLKVNSR